ncbi:MAG: alpha/beta hydrolase [Polaromonas sp.]
MMTQSQGVVEFQESGSGQTIVFVPGSFSTGSSWRGITTLMSARYRVITTSLSGYGKTQERRVAGSGAHMDDEMDVLEAVLKQAGVPVHLVAHSFGAWVALNTAVHRKTELLSLTLLEPTAFNLLDLAGESGLSNAVHAMTARFISNWNSGDQQAVRHVINFYGGEGAFESYPSAVQMKLIAQTPTNILDWQTGSSATTGLSDLAKLAVPTCVICGDLSHTAMKRSNELLAKHLPRAKLSYLRGANHFMIGSHAAELATAIDQHIGESSYAYGSKCE